MANHRFSLTVRISTENSQAVKRALKGYAPGSLATATEEGLILRAKPSGPSARELNRELLSTLRRIERKTQSRAEWTCRGTTERFFDYVPKGARKA